MFVIGSLIAATLAVGYSQEEPPRGAKALFYDATSTAKVVSASGKSDAPKSAAAPRRESQPAASSEPKPYGLCYWIELVDSQGGAPQRVTDGRTFRSGERIRLHFQSNVDGRIRLLQIGSSGTATLLFPDATRGLSDDVLRAGEDRILPAETAWFRFDENPGTEELLLFFAHAADQLPTSIRPSMDSESTRIIVAAADRIGGSKDLVLEVDSAPPGSGVDARTPIGPSRATGASFVVNRSGEQPVVVKIRLKHQ